MDPMALSQRPDRQLSSSRRASRRIASNNSTRIDPTPGPLDDGVNRSSPPEPQNPGHRLSDTPARPIRWGQIRLEPRPLPSWGGARILWNTGAT